MSAALILRVIFWSWFAGAVAAGHFLLLARLPPLGLPLLVLALAGLVLVLFFRVSALRAWLDSVDLRLLVLLHASRLVGIYFLILHQRGELPRAFAAVAGAGDLVVGAMALPVALAPLTDAARARAIRIWSIVSLVTLLLIVFTLGRLNFSSPLSMLALTRLPLCLYATMLLPLLFAAQITVLRRSAATSPDA